MDTSTINYTFPIYYDVNNTKTPFHDLVLRKVVVDSVVMSLGDKITGEVYYPTNSLIVTMQEYVEYKGVRYSLVSPPTILREGLVSDNSELKGMTKYSFTFYHPMYQLSNMPFTDVAVSEDETKYLSQNGTFSWTGTGVDFIAKLNKNLHGTEWIVVANTQDTKSMANLNSLPDEIAPTKAGQEKNSNVLSFDNVMIADALKTCYDTWKVPFVIDQIKEGEAHYSEGKRYLVLFGLPSNEIATATTETVNIDTYLDSGFFCSTTSIELHSGDVITLLSDVSAVAVIEDTMSGNRIPLTDTYKATRNVTVYIGHGGGAISVNIRIASVFIFRMGQGVGLKNNSRTPRNNKIITRIAGYGSTDNIQYGYPHIVWTGDQSWDYTINNASGMQPIVVEGETIEAMSYPIYDGYINGQKVRLIQHPFTRDVLMPSIYRDTVNKKVNPLAEGYNPNIEIKDYYDAPNGYPNPINLAAPSYQKQAFDGIKPRLQTQQGEDYGIVENAVPYEPAWTGYKTFAQWRGIVASKLAESRPQRGVRSWAHEIWSGIASATNVEEQTPTRVEAGYWEKIAGSTTASVTITLSGHFFIVKLVSDWENNSWRVLQPNESISDAWDDTYDTEKDEYAQSYFTMKLPQLDFDLYACASVTQEMKINMRSGACQGCTFPVEVDWEDYKKNFYKEVDGKVVFDPVIHNPDLPQDDGHVRNGSKYPDSSQGQITLLFKKEIETFGTLMPNIYQQPKGESEEGANDGDKFVILGISLPQSYVTNAETLLDETMMQYMLENNVHYFDYPLKFDEHFLATHQDILAQMRNNTIVRFEYPRSESGQESITNALYIKQMTVKYGDSPLPQYDITLTDDVEIVLNQVGQVTDDVSRMRVQMNELQKYYGEEVIARINEKLSKVADDVAQGRITFQQGLDTIGDAFIHGTIGSPQFETGLYTGKGWRIDNLGNAEMESLRVRSYLEIVELLVNRMQAQEGDTMFSNNDQIDKVDQVVDETTGNVSYILSLKEKWEGYITSQQEGNILKGTINTLAAKQAGISDVTTTDVYYTSWMQVVEVGSSESNTLGVNQIRVVLYGDNQTPAGRNFVPCELMTIARWGNILNPDEQGITENEKKRRMALQSSFYISTSEGRIAKLTGVNKPILESYNYGTTLGIVPDFVKNWSIANRLIDGRDYLYAQGVIVGDFIKVDIQGRPLVNYVDCGEWYDGGAQGAQPTVGHGIYLFEEKNNTNLQYETHEVWHNGAFWRAKMHQPVVSGGVTTYYEPTDNNSAYWQKLMASGDSTQNIYYRGNDTPDTPTGDAPQGWTTYPQGVSQSLKNEYISTRIKSDGTWSNWSTPALFAHYAEDGTSISITGSALKHYATWAAFSADTQKIIGKTYLVDENANGELRPLIVVWSQGATGNVANVDDCYLVQEDGHLFQAQDTIEAWNDLGQIKGDKGDSGRNTSMISIYKRATSIAYSDKPTGTLTYDFGNGSLTGTLNEWSTNIPSNASGLPCWVRQVFVSSESQTTTITESAWSTANKLIEDGNSIKIEQQHASYFDGVDAQGNPRPQASAEVLGQIDLLKYDQSGEDMIDVVEIISGEYSWEAYTVPFGTCYIFNDHLYEATEQGWVDLGKFKGDDAVVYEIVFEKNIFVLNPNTNKIQVDVKGKVYKIEGETRTGVTLSLSNFSLRKVMDTTPEIEAQLPLIFSQNTFTCKVEETYTAEKLLKAVLRIDNTDVAIESVPLVTDGQSGERGKRGRFYYYAGMDWSDNPNISFSVSDAEAPYFSYTPQGQNTQYWVFNPERNGSYTMQEMGQPSSQNANWELMTNDFKYLITEAIFANFAKMASFIFSGVWMLSEQGVVGYRKRLNHSFSCNILNGGGTENVTSYTLFDGNYPDSSYNLLCQPTYPVDSEQTPTSITVTEGNEQVLASNLTLSEDSIYLLYCVEAQYCGLYLRNQNNEEWLIDSRQSAEDIDQWFKVPTSGTYSLVMKAIYSGHDAKITGTSVLTKELFTPNFAVNSQTGVSYQQKGNGVFKGECDFGKGTIGNFIIGNTIKGGGGTAFTEIHSGGYVNIQRTDINNALRVDGGSVQFSPDRGGSIVLGGGDGVNIYLGHWQSAQKNLVSIGNMVVYIPYQGYVHVDSNGYLFVNQNATTINQNT